MIRKILLFILVILMAIGLKNSFVNGVTLPIKWHGEKIETK